MTGDATDLIAERNNFSTDRMASLRSKISGLSEVSSISDLCIYVTGSYARGEASKYSDLDLFFLVDRQRSKDPTTSISRIQKTLMDAALIKACRSLNYPEFSNQGQYLEIHDLEDMINNLGSPADDFENLFTARMLLLLESSSIQNDEVYEASIKKIIATYFRDYHDHEQNFLPIFLVNDVIRFWKTMCLNYEHKRNRAEKSREDKNKAHLKNLKLKFSRLMTCFSCVALLCARDSADQEYVFEIVRQTPVERIKNLQESDEKCAELIDKLMRQYQWFIKFTDQDKASQLNDIQDQNTRNEAFRHAREFGKLMHDLVLTSSANTDNSRFLVI